MQADSSRRYANLAGGQIRNVKSTTSRGDDIWASVERAASGSTRGYSNTSRPTNSRDHFPALGGPSIPGSAGHSKAAVSQLRSAGAGSSASWGNPSTSTSTPKTQPPKAFSVQISTSSKIGGSSNRAPPKPTEASFPSLPTNAKAAALASYKREVMARPHAKNGNSRSLTGSGNASGSSTPAGWGNSGDNSDYPTILSPPLDRNSNSHGPNPDELHRSLLDTSLNDEGRTQNGGGGKKKKNKGVLLATMGGVQRGA